MKNKAIVFGATGLVGSFLKDELLASGMYEEVITPVRRLQDEEVAGVRQVLVNYSKLDIAQFPMGADIFVAIGTTRRKTPNLQQYHAIDVGIPVAVAKLAAAIQARCLVVVSAVDANEHSGNFYLRMKGEMERLISESFSSAYFVRPAMLRGPRKEFRFGELVFRVLSPAIDLLMWGRLKRYRSINARDVARAMIYLSQKGYRHHVVQAPELHRLSRM